MAISLWRNGERLGDIAVEYPTHQPGAVAGMLVPTAAYADIEPLMQVRHELLPGKPVFQVRGRQRSQDGVVTLEPLSEAESKGVRREQSFEVRDDRGEVLEMNLISIDHDPVPPGDSAISRACAALGTEPSGWMLAAFPARWSGGAPTEPTDARS